MLKIGQGQLYILKIGLFNESGCDLPALLESLLYLDNIRIVVFVFDQFGKNKSHILLST